MTPGYRQTEVGVIPEDWQVKSLGEIAHIKTGGRNNQDKVDEGEYPFFVRSAMVERINSYSYDCEAILVPGEGDIGNIFHYICGRFDVHQRVYAITQFSPKTSGRFIYFYMAEKFGAHAMQNSVKATVDSLRLPTFQNFKIAMPPDTEEQTAIADALSDADSLIDSLENLLAKKRGLKQGAMQELFIGKKRLPGFSGEWKVKRMGDLAVLSKAGVNPATTPNALFTHFSLPAFDAGAVPVVEQGSCIGSNKFVVPARAVLLSKLNPRIPRIWAPSYIPSNAVCSTEFLVLVPRECADREFLAALCRSPAMCYQMELHATGTTGSHQRMNPSQALAIEINVPEDQGEQKAIADVLSDMDADIIELQHMLSKVRQLKQGMMQELLTGRARLI